jgi:membrane-bound serine protease (ClpP class)
LIRIFFILFLSTLMVGASRGEPSQGTVYLVEIEGMVDRGLLAYVQRVLDTADEDERSRAVLFRINTPGGALDAALRIKDAILDSPVPTIAFVDRQALSAGALITLAAGEIYMVPGAVIGAATPVTGMEGQTASEKVISAVRKAFAATAEARGRDPRIAEAMVDESVEIPGLTEAGKLLTLTTEEALQWKFIDAVSESLRAFQVEKGITDDDLVATSPSPAERSVRFLTHPVVSSLLITIGFLGLLFEIQTAGWGIGGAIGLVSLGLFFFGHMLAGLAGWEGLFLVVTGIILMVLEAFVIPGFGIAGVLGILAFLGGLYVSMVGDFSNPDQLNRAAYILFGSLLFILVGAWLSLRFLPRTRSFRGLMLPESMAPGRTQWSEPSGEEGPFEGQSLRGSRGVALTDLRPAGAAEIEGKRVDVVTEGDWLERGTEIEVIQDTGYRRVVRAAGTIHGKEIR